MPPLELDFLAIYGTAQHSFINLKLEARFQKPRFALSEQQLFFDARVDASEHFRFSVFTSAISRETVMKVLIVEDEILVAMDMQATLEESGYEVVGIAADMNGATALAALKPDIALVDLNLRDGRTGLLIAAKLVEASIQVILVTANPRSVLAGGAKGIGLLSKPCDAASLIQAVEYYEAADQSNRAPPDSLQLLF